MNALLGALGDPSTRLLAPSQWKAFLDEVSDQPTVGVGLRELLDVDLRPDGSLAVVTTQPGGSAAASGLRPGDVLLRIDGAEVRRSALAEGMDRLRGPVGTPVRVDVLRGTQKLTVELRRTALPGGGDHVRAARVPGHPALQLALDGFSGETADAVRAVLERHPGIPVVLDLRNNPGGQVDAALGVAGAFLGEGPVARRRTREGTEPLQSTGARIGPPRVVVLVNEGTASAAELLTLALRDVGHATVIGQPTRGKALIHAPSQMPDDSWLLISTGRILALDGTELLDHGITPEVSVAWPDSARVPLPVGSDPARDPQLAAALERLDRGV